MTRPFPIRNFLKGATTKAEELGYTVNRFFFEEHRSVRPKAGESGISWFPAASRARFFVGSGPVPSAFGSIGTNSVWCRLRASISPLPLPMQSPRTKVTMAREAVRRLWKQGVTAASASPWAGGGNLSRPCVHRRVSRRDGVAPELEAVPPLLLTNGQSLESWRRISHAVD